MHSFIFPPFVFVELLSLVYRSRDFTSDFWLAAQHSGHFSQKKKKKSPNKLRLRCSTSKDTENN